MNELEKVIDDWIEWLRTRRFYAPPLPQNILAMLAEKNSKVTREPPNANNDALCAAFNLVISTAPDEERLPFMYVYVKRLRPQPVKCLASNLGIDRDTVYQRAHVAAPKYLSQAKALADLNSKLQKEVEDFID